MFHQGVVLPGKHRMLEGGGDTVRYLRFADAAEVGGGALQAAISAWIRL